MVPQYRLTPYTHRNGHEIDHTKRGGYCFGKVDICGNQPEGGVVGWGDSGGWHQEWPQLATPTSITGHCSHVSIRHHSRLSQWNQWLQYQMADQEPGVTESTTSWWSTTMAPWTTSPSSPSGQSTMSFLPEFEGWKVFIHKSCQK